MSKPKQRRYTADLHLGHEKVAGLRGYDTVREHDTALARVWCDTVPEDAELFILGDLSAGGAAAEAYALSMVRDMPGRKHLILGNHDRGHPAHKNGREKLAAYADLFATVGTIDCVSIAGQNVILSHFPYELDHTDKPRYMQWRPRDEGRFLIHGHVHDAWLLKERQINVGWDKWGPYFATDSDIAQLIRWRLDLEETFAAVGESLSVESTVY